MRTVRSKPVSCNDAARDAAAAARSRAIFCWADSFAGAVEVLSNDIWFPRAGCGDADGFEENVGLLAAYGPVAVKRVASVGDRTMMRCAIEFGVMLCVYHSPLGAVGNVHDLAVFDLTISSKEACGSAMRDQLYASTFSFGPHVFNLI